MAKVTITADGVAETFEFDGTSTMLSEAMQLERELGMTYGEWMAGLAGGSARSARTLAGYIWLVWRRNGRDVALADILAGKPEIDLRGFSVDTGQPVAPKHPATRRRKAG